MQGQKLSNAIGLAMKAGKCQSGDFSVEKLVRAGNAKLVILDSEASQATKERYRRLCERMQTPLLLAEQAGQAIGKPERIVLAITDPGFSAMIQNAAVELAAKRNAATELTAAFEDK